VTRAKLASFAIAGIIRALGATLRFRVHDPAGVCRDTGGPPFIWVFWHNRLLVLPYVRVHFLGHRAGAGLASASKDGEFIAETWARFGVPTVRGSTSRRSRESFLKLVKLVRSGLDVGITPDGPRGPCYRLQPGVVKLAAVTGARILPIHFRFHRAWKLRSWDGFRIPWPFSAVEVTLGPPVRAEDAATPEALEAARASLEQAMLDGTRGSA
jgi:lysophospholipid acyltransferase (LPLAT)-like uncharacterized protein